MKFGEGLFHALTTFTVLGTALEFSGITHTTQAAKGQATGHASGVSRSLNVLFALALACACVPALGETLVIPGSGNPEYIVGELAKAFNARQPLHTVIVPTTTGTAGALRDVSEGRTSLGRIGRPLSESERNQGFSAHSLGHDPIVFVGGAGVTVRDITRAQVLAIYSGQLYSWGPLGDYKASIRAIGREKTDASYRAIARAIREFENIKYADTVKLVHLDSQLLELLDRYPASFGFLNRSALAAAKSPLVLLSLDAVEANAENLAAGRYPISTEIGLVYKEHALSEAARAFLKFVDSAEGIQLLRAHGLVASLPAMTPLASGQ
jgi:phosphate transport system substrate-binding protein